MSKFLDIFVAIVGVALATVLVTNTYTAQIITAFGKSFASGLNVANGGKGLY